MFTCPGASKLPEWNSPAATVSAAHAADRSWIAATGSKHVPWIRHMKYRAAQSGLASDSKTAKSKCLNRSTSWSVP